MILGAGRAQRTRSQGRKDRTLVAKLFGGASLRKATNPRALSDKLRPSILPPPRRPRLTTSPGTAAAAAR